ncbi:transmembrane protein 179B-like isoform X2 [Asterias amurensis]|uniref:transmembrane protein 179B-like isoform X2 n=1 Tax=Asterias amurensis TaxID=7602 RepID=UPI003AB68087
MAVDGCLLITETVLYFVVFFTGLISAVTVGISRVSFSGDCLLFAEVKWCNSTAFYFTELGSNGVCGFSVGLEIIACFYALLFGLYHVSIFFQWAKERRELLLPAIIINVLCLVLLFIDSCILSIGFKRFCASLTSGASLGSKVTDCATVPGDLDWNSGATCGTAQDKKTHGTYAGGNFFGFLTTAQSASWFTVLFWALLLAVLIARRLMDKGTPEDGATVDERKPMLT